MVIYVFSDESGVFDQRNNEVFVFAGLLLFSYEEKEAVTRKYLTAEKVVKNSAGLGHDDEAKACVLSNHHKGKLYRSMNQVHKFAAVVNQRGLLPTIFENKKSKQRHLDFVFKVGLRKALERLIKTGVIDADSVTRVEVFCDEHSTATDGRYELQEALEGEFKTGTHNYNWNKFYPPIFTNLQSVKLRFCNSKTVPLIRSADIVANRVYFHALKGKISDLTKPNLTITNFPLY